MPAPELNPDLLNDAPEDGSSFGTTTRGNHATHGDAFSGGNHHIDKSCVVRQNIYCAKALEASAYTVRTSSYGDPQDPQFDPEHVYTTNIVEGFVKNDAAGNFLFGQAGGGTGATALDNLTDVTLTFPAGREYLCFDSASSMWVNQVIVIDDLGDVVITTPTDGQHLVFDLGTGTWINKNSNTLDALDDVVLTSPANGQFLRFNGADWVNAALVDADVPDTLTLDAVIDGNGNELVNFVSVLSAVNFVSVENAVAGGPICVRATGDDASVDLAFGYKGQGTSPAISQGAFRLGCPGDGISQSVRHASGASAFLFIDGNSSTDSFLEIKSQSGGIRFRALSGVGSSSILIFDTGGATGEHLWLQQGIAVADGFAKTTAGFMSFGNGVVEADITDLQAYLLDITAESLGDLSDVSAALPTTGDHLEFDGTNWIPAAPAAGGGPHPKNVELESIFDASTNKFILFNAAVIAVNYLQLDNGATGNPVILSAQSGSDTTVDLLLTTRGNGTILLGNSSAAKTQCSGELRLGADIQFNAMTNGGNVDLKDANGQCTLQLQSDDNAPVNFLVIKSGDTGQPVNIFASGADASIDLRLRGKGPDGKVVIRKDVALPNGDLCVEGKIDATAYEVKGLSLSGGFVKNDAAGIFLFDQAGDGGASALNDLSDVTITTPSPGSVLQFDGAAWIDRPDVELSSTSAYYLGDPSTDGTWRFVRNGTDLEIERREVGVFVSKGSFVA